VADKNYQNLIIGFQVTVKNVGNTFLRHSVVKFSPGTHTMSTLHIIQFSVKFSVTFAGGV